MTPVQENSVAENVHTTLVIDDDPDLQDFIGIILADIGIRKESMTEFDSSGVCESTADLLIVDMFLGQSDGIEVLDALGAVHSTTPILLISSLPDEVLKAAVEYGQMLGLHIAGAIRKPFSFSQLAAAIETLSNPPPRSLSPTDVMGAVDEGRLALRYQPKIDLLSGEISGVEVLSRIWTRNGVAVPPAAFLDAIENKKISSQFALKVIENALSELDSMTVLRGRRSIAINIDVGVLEDSAFPLEVKRLCDTFGYAPEHLLFEITERQMADCNRVALRGALRLTVHGFGLSLDDFGTGLSNFLRLEQLPVGEVKIDKSLLEKAAIDNVGVSEVEALMEYAREKSLRVVCEGIEDEEMLTLARRMKVRYVQGYRLARPMADNDLEAWLDSRAEKIASACGGETTPRSQSESA